MLRFKYKAKKGTDKIVEGVLMAGSQVEAINKLAEQNLFPIEVEVCDSAGKNISERAVSPGAAGFKNILRKISQGKISSKEVLVFTQKLATLTRAKMELLPCLEILHGQIDNPAFKDVILKVRNWLKEGKSLSESLRNFPAVFSPLFISIVRAGEASGNMEAALTQVTDFMQTQESFKNKVSGALVYPAILSCVGIMSIFVILNFVIPKLRGIFNQLGSDIPVVTKIILKLSQITSENWMWMLLLLAVVAVIIFYKGTKFFFSFLKWLVMRLPILKRLLKNQELANFSRALSLLIRSGVTPLQSLEIASLSVEDSRMKEELAGMLEKIRDGQAIFESMREFKSMPDFFIKMIAIGEKSGRLEEVLNEVAHSYAQQIEQDIGVIASLLEPVLILMLGVVLGGIVLSILLPIFQVTQMMH